MASFSYSVITSNGKTKKGTIEAEDREKALATLKADGNSVMTLDAAGALNKDLNFNIKKKIKSKDFMVFCRQFNSLLEAGVGVITALDMLGEQTEQKTLKEAILNARDSVQRGDTLATAMKKEKVFPSILVSMIEAGEQSGNLETSLARMAEHFEKDNRTKGALKKAMIYPIVLLVVAVAVLVIMVVAVLPGFTDMFADMGTSLPALTVGLMDLSKFLRSYWYIVIAIIAVLVFLGKLFVKSDFGSHFLAKLAIKLPVFGDLTVKTACSGFARTFSTMMASGMPMVEAMNITARTMDNVLFKEALEEAAVQVQRGVTISQVLKKSNLFPPLILHMVGIGEETGNLETMLNNCANYYDEEVQLATESVMALLEPMIIIVLAGIVILILAAIYGPMITLYSAMDSM